MKTPVYTNTNDTSPQNRPDFQHLMETLEAFEKLDYDINRKNLNSFNSQDLEARILSNQDRYGEIINQLTLNENMICARLSKLLEAWGVNYRAEKDSEEYLDPVLSTDEFCFNDEYPY